MATELRLPEVGENVESGQVVKVLVSAGDTIKPDQSVLELETDKAVIEVPSTLAGKVETVHVKEGDELEVGGLILTVEDLGEVEAKSVEPESEEETQSEPEVEAQESKPEAVAGAAGQEVAATDKRPPPAESRPVAKRDIEPSREVAPAAPSVRRLARELGLDINRVPGSGPAGRISSEDVKQYVRLLQEERREEKPAQRVATESSPLPDFSKWGDVERVKMSGIRRATARRMEQAWPRIPLVTNFDKADVTELEQLRKQYAEKAEAAGGKLTVTAIILKVVASALRTFPKFNASLDMASEEIIYKNYYHIGIAVDTEHGLLVPVIRDVDRKNMIELSVELTEMAEKSRNRKISPEDLEGSNFTITNLGGIGGTNFAPLINPPNVAILGIARASMDPIFKNGGFEPRLMLPLSLSYDHRLIDGADAARFLRWVVQALEQPFLIALEG